MSTRHSISDRPLWVIGLMYTFHIAYIASCFVVITTRYCDAIAARFGSPIFVIPAVILAIAVLPLVASFFTLGREYWELLGRGGPPRQAALKIALVGLVLTAMLAGVVRYAHPLTS